MNQAARVRAVTLLIVGLALIIASAKPESVVALGDDIRILSASVVSEFPEGMRYSIEVEGENEIEEISVRLKVGRNQNTAYEYFESDQATLVESELFWRTGIRGRYIPPGTIITYYFLIKDTEGNELATEPAEFIYHDARFEWEEVTEGPVSVAYHGPVRRRAEIVLEAITDTIAFMGPLLGADTEAPIRVTMYNNVKEMLEALPPGSSTIRRELITEGQAFTDIGTLLVLGGGRGATGTASHELTHILNHRAGDSIIRRIPSWLDEGLAEYGNVAPGFSYDIALEFALGTDRLLPITSMPVLPGDPEDVIIFYGQARSIVEFMIAAYGRAAMRELLAVFREGVNMDDAIEQVYGISRIELENQWREIIGAPMYVPPERDSARPTPVPRRAIQLYSLTPQAGSEQVGTIDSTPTPTPEPPTPTPIPTQPPAVAKVEPTPTPEAEPAAITETSDEQTESGGSSGCGLPDSESLGLSDLAVPLFALGLVGLALRRRRK
ncbi:MAG: hypothetical protein F4X94_06135 [Dehalococcoidia bacterium]|nr:hypothetical protein [Dehalococcoidia bacterium]